MRMLNWCALWGALFTATVAQDNRAGERPRGAESRIDFVADVQPILRQSCYSCHGSETQEAGLRLDLKGRAFAGSDNGKVILSGRSAESRLLSVVAGLDEEVGMMPPEGEGTPLTPEQIAVLRTWVDQGAQWPDEADATESVSHWAFQPIARPAIPTVQDSHWILNPIDAFVLGRLEQEGIHPAPEADRATLIRRVHLDLIGLPPTPADVDAFLRDSTPDAYSRMVDRVLASLHFGERWSRHWLDLARYADSDGYEKDRERPHAWRYRDWVINAINGDLPYDQFSILQIAGDMLPNADIEDKVATGFHRNTLHNTEGGTDQEEDRVKKTIDRTNTVGTIWLGLTVGCAQCHSHKYDPLTQREYYQLYAFFNSIDEIDVGAPLPLDRQRYEQAKQAFEREHSALQSAVAEYEQTKLADAQRTWETTAVTDETVVWRTINVAHASSQHGGALEQQDDGSLLATGKNEASDKYIIKAVVSDQVTAVRLEVLPDDSLPKQGPGRADNGNFVLTTFQVLATQHGSNLSPIELVNARSDFAQKDWEPAKAINDDPNDGWAVSPEFGKRHVAAFDLKEPTRPGEATSLTFVLDQHYPRKNAHNLGRFRLSVTSHKLPVALEGMPAAVADALQVPSSDRTPEQSQAIAEYYKSQDPELRRLKKMVSDHARQAPKPSDVKAQTVSQLSEPRETKVLIRGDFLSPGDVVSKGVPAALPPLSASETDRLDFAHWLFAADNPLTPRVTVNRLWQHLLGRGLVATVDDFGTQGEPPSHPELLDWLAAEFREQGWSIKRMLRLILTSRTYRQSSAFRQDLAQIDPENMLLARQQRQRVEAELIRDLALAVSGLFDPRLGGPSVRPAQPAEYSELTYANSAKWQVSPGGDAYRRGLYTFFRRTSPYPMLMTFDSPDSTECCPERSLSNTPLQALTLWNDLTFFECAQSLGSRIVRDVPPVAEVEPTLRQRAIHAFRVCLARQPSEAELDEVVALFRQAVELQQEERTQQLLGSTSVPRGCSPQELAAWVVVARTLLNLDEFITRE